MVTISATITNAGDRAGDEVVQLYTHDTAASVVRPRMTLSGFTRITLGAGESKRVSFLLSLSQLSYYEDGAHVLEPGAVEVMVGASSADIRLRGMFTIDGTKTPLDDQRVFFSVVKVE
jgi:beta-glucosidase